MPIAQEGEMLLLPNELLNGNSMSFMKKEAMKTFFPQRDQIEEAMGFFICFAKEIIAVGESVEQF